MDISVPERHLFGRVENTLPTVENLIPACGKRRTGFKNFA